MEQQAYFDFVMHITAGVCVTAIIIAVLFFINRTKLAKQKTIQSLIAAGKEVTPELLESLGIRTKHSPSQDFRKGILLLVMGLILTLIFKIMGGIGWILGLIPIIAGLVYLAFSKMKAAKI